MDLNRYLKGVLIVGAFGPWGALLACLNSYTRSRPAPMPLNGTYACGQTVNFCFTVTNWSQQNTNWFHGLSIALGPGWDASTLTPVSAPPPCQGTGSWDWYTSVTGTAGTNIGPQGPGWFFNTGAPGRSGQQLRGQLRRGGELAILLVGHRDEHARLRGRSGPERNGGHFRRQ
jgi:hypothetical protein